MARFKELKCVVSTPLWDHSMRYVLFKVPMITDHLLSPDYGLPTKKHDVHKKILNIEGGKIISK